MIKVAYTGLRPASLLLLQDNLQNETMELTEVVENNIRTFLMDSTLYDVIVIGEATDNPLKVAQAIYSIDKQISIIIVNDPVAYQKIKQALLFTPFIGNTVDCVSSAIGPGLAAVIRNAVLRSQQRRSYATLKEAHLTAFLQSNPYEKVKSEYLDKFFVEAPIAAILVNQEGFIQALNRHATYILQATEKEALGMSLASFFDAPTQEEVYQFIRAHATSTSHIFARSLNGRYQYLEMKVADIATQNTNTFKISIIEDVTEKIQSQRKIQKQLEELEQINKTLKHANTDLDTFIYTASHDLKAPIANIEGLISILEKGVDGTDSRFSKIFDMLKVSINRFQATIKDLTEFTRLQQDHSADVDTIQVQEIVEEVKSLLQELMNTSEAVIELDCKEPCTVKFSRSNLRSIIYNLLSNAIKYRSPNRKPHINITTQLNGNELLLTVKDNGLGFAKKQRNKIFSMFQRFHTHVEGTGVGLFIVKRIVDNAGGRVELESEENVGTTFKIYLKQ